MERTVLYMAATWIGGVGAWGVGVGYALGAARARMQSTGMQTSPRMMQFNNQDEPPTPPVEVVDISSLPAPPQPLEAPDSDGSKLRDAAPSDDLLKEMEEFLLRKEQQLAAVEVFDEEDDDMPSPILMDAKGDVTSGLDLRPTDASALLTESQQRRLAPIKPLRRERRSRKIRKAGPKDDKFVPLVPGARSTQSEAILNAYNGKTLDVKREQGEDYWVDPELLQNEIQAKELVRARRKEFKQREKVFGEDRLRQEIAAPYKNNLIGAIVVGIGVVGVVFANFPGLLELNEPSSIASFPSEL